MADGTPQRRPVKSEAAFRTIREVSEHLDVPQHVLRFWESRFPQIKPLRRAGGRRYYRPTDVQLLARIRDLLYRDGFTIKGVQNLLCEHGRSRLLEEDVPVAVATAAPELPLVPAQAAEGTSKREQISAVVDELEELRRLLERSISRRCHRDGGGL